ncbi:hypothetical protein QBC38DRAFT_504182 [Podospora fimiseda]|uniref:Uncharacterized protein n=1 Tax=Podospora fimiseda TaxID=252190 RepID=A0AAN7BGN6_9PEZI|nr:hypothetical protein QBC38DRAFT_504182 [Podospora fimiseda]
MIAPKFQSPSYDTIYLAGLWLLMGCETTMEHLRTNVNTHSLIQLLWAFRQDNFTAQPSHTYVAPSFSWASISADLSFCDVTLFHLQKSLARVLSASKQLINEDEEYGRVSDASVKLYEPLLPCTLSWETVRDEFRMTLNPQTTPGFCFEPTAHFDCHFSQLTLADGRKTLQRSPTFHGFAETPASLLILGTFDPSRHVRGLIVGLHPTRNGYQRLGLIELISREGPGSSLHPGAEDFTSFYTEVTLY